jgi:hypothetical protein
MKIDIGGIRERMLNILNWSRSAFFSLYDIYGGICTDSVRLRNVFSIDCFDLSASN